MGVYVDQMKIPYGRMLMCHMLADSLDELHDMAQKLGLKRQWFQNAEGSTPHYDICQEKRAKAIELGAVEIDRRRTVEIIQDWRERGKSKRQSKKAAT